MRSSLLVLSLIACGGKDEEDTNTSTTPTTPVETGTPPESIDMCAYLGRTPQPWNEGPYETALKGVADDFTVPARGGDWNFKENFSGCETLLFVPSVPTQEEGWPTPLWQRDAEELVEKLPMGTHVFFVSSASNPDDMDADLDLIKREINNALDDLPDEEKALRKDHFHYVRQTVADLEGWVGDYLRSPGFGFGIDRFQRIRNIGSLADGQRYNSSFGWFEPNLAHVAHEAIYYDFEADRQAELDAQGAFVVPTFTGQIVSDSGWAGVKGYVEVDLPDAATMATFDTLVLDHDMTCDGPGELGYCPAWDRITTLFLCAQPTEALPNPDPTADDACQPYVPGVGAVAEVLGSCVYDGVAPGDTCVTADDCTSDTGAVYVTCEGYVAPVPEVPAVPADTLPCACEEPDGAVVDAVRSCEADGVGYGECACSCDDEVGRWISTYHREGRYVQDASFALPWLAEGGHQRFAYYTIDPYEIAIDLRFVDSDAPRPTDTHFLFGGGNFDAAYNDRYAPVEVEIPATAAKVELAVLITGHGMAMPGNCAEFCNTDHHFLVNGTDHTIDFPEVGDDEGCQNDVANGTVPNQFGTWFYGRSNWCPGREVDPIYIDVTDQVTKGALNTFEYSGYYQGAPYEPGGASIAMSSWLVVRE